MKRRLSRLEDVVSLVLLTGAMVLLAVAAVSDFLSELTHQLMRKVEGI